MSLGLGREKISERGKKAGDIPRQMKEREAKTMPRATCRFTSEQNRSSS